MLFCFFASAAGGIISVILRTIHSLYMKKGKDSVQCETAYERTLRRIKQLIKSGTGIWFQGGGKVL